MLILGLILFVGLVVIHEFGHFLVAKRGGVKVEEFGIGFPPKLAGKTMGRGIWRAYYSLNLLPLGGFVKLKGENSEDTRPGSFGAATLATKVKIILAGVGMNFLAAIVLFSIVAAIRMPVVLENQFTIPPATTIVEDRIDIVSIQPDSPAAQAQLEAGDTLVSINGEPIKNYDDVNRLAAANGGQTIDVVVKDSTQGGGALEETKAVTLRANPQDGESYIGIGLNRFQEQRVSPWAAPIVGLGLTVQFTGETLHLLGQAVVNIFQGNVAQAGEGVAGPVGIFNIIAQIDSVVVLLLIGGLISLSLAIMNVLPIPALDGGRLAVMLLFKAIRKPLSPKLENTIHGAGMAVLLLLVVLITIVDVKRVFGS